ncbi:MAG: hypothetical protein ACQEV7_01365 [Bacillota bacterium]
MVKLTCDVISDRLLGFSRKITLKYKITFILLIFLICGDAIYYQILFTPKDSLELYQAIDNADNLEEVHKKLMLEGYLDNFKEEDFDFINNVSNSPKRVSQFTLLEYEEKTFLIVTSPGTERLKVLSVEELPTEIRDYFLELP